MKEAPEQPADAGPVVERGVVRPLPERDNVSAGGADRASESDSRHPANGDPYTTARTPTAEERDILRHALGYGRRTAPGWRNHFVTGPGTTDYPHCEALVAAGLMTKREGSALSGWDAVYTVTAEGKAAARSKTHNVVAEGPSR